MTLAEMTQQIRSRAATLPETMSGLAGRTEAVRAGIVSLQSETQVAQEQMRSELQRIPEAARTVQHALREGQQRVLQRVQAAEDALRHLQQLVQTAETDLGQGVAQVKQDAESLGQALPAVQTAIQAQVEAQRAQLDRDRGAEEAAHQSLQTALTQASQTMQRLTAQGVETLAHQTAQAEALTDGLRGLSPQLARSRQQFENDLEVSSKHYHAGMAEIGETIVRPLAQRVGEDTGAGLQERVNQPARASADGLVQVLHEASRQMQEHEHEVGPLRQKVERSFKEMQSGPQLRPLVKASKHVLQKVGKLSSLGPLANSL